ncbi:MAG: PIN domain-containing protein [Patescibacteria group bacterium]|nr:PIN domain-containing protein [Patescibacteria group bacterium]
MPTISKVFIDTNIFVAIKDDKDSTHDRAILLLKTLKSKKVRFFTSSDVIGESITVISKKLGKLAAIEFLSRLNDYAEEIFIDKYLHQETRDVFKRIKSKNISFIDCSSVVAMKRHKIKSIFSFDQDFKKLGVKLAK